MTASRSQCSVCRLDSSHYIEHFACVDFNEFLFLPYPFDRTGLGLGLIVVGLGLTRHVWSRSHSVMVSLTSLHSMPIPASTELTEFLYIYCTPFWRPLCWRQRAYARWSLCTTTAGHQYIKSAMSEYLCGRPTSLAVGICQHLRSKPQTHISTVVDCIFIQQTLVIIHTQDWVTIKYHYSHSAVETLNEIRIFKFKLHTFSDWILD